MKRREFIATAVAAAAAPIVAPGTFPKWEPAMDPTPRCVRMVQRKLGEHITATYQVTGLPVRYAEDGTDLWYQAIDRGEAKEISVRGSFPMTERQT